MLLTLVRNEKYCNLWLEVAVQYAVYEATFMSLSQAQAVGMNINSIKSAKGRTHVTFSVDATFKKRGN